MGIVINSGTILRGSTVRSSYPGDNYLPYTTLLLNGNGANNANNNVFVDASTNNFAITRNGNATQGTFSPFSKSGWSNYFDGSGDSLTLTGVNLSSGNWTIECFVYFQSFATTTTSHIFSIGTDGNNRFALYRISTTSKFNFITVNSGVYVSAESTTVPTVGQWYHVAVVSNSGTRTLYVNGVAEVTSTSAINNGTSYSIGNLQYTPGVSDPLTGYISNFRVVTAAVYTGNFTPPTAPLTAISGTSLLTCQSNRFIDTNTQAAAKTITVNGDTSVVAFSPFASTDDWNASVHGGSGYFDGTGDYLALVTGIPVPSTGTFTIEAWIYLTDTTEEAIWTQYSAGTAGRSSLRVSSGKLIFANASASTITTTASVPTNAWTHVAAVRDSSNNLMLFINGNLDVTSASYTASIQQIAATIGAFSDVSSALSGYISNLRITNTAVYTSTFTPPTALLTAITNTSLLLNFTNAGIYDATGKNNLETVGDAKISTAQSKFGLASMAFDGTGDYLLSSAALSELIFLHNGTPWTIEGWFYTGSTSQQVILSTNGTSLSIGMIITLNDTTTRDIVAYIYRGVSGSWVASFSPTNSWSLNTWTHFAVIQDSSKNLTIYINGVQVSTASGSSFSFSSANPSYPLAIGRAQQPTPAAYFNGYIQDLRITKGYARYTSNFTPPERQLLGKA